VRNQYKVLAEKYHIICEAEDTTSNDIDPFNGYIYEYSVYSLINDIRYWPHAKEFIDWLVNKSDTYSRDLTEIAENNDVSAIEAACIYFDGSAENYIDGYNARADDREEDEEESDGYFEDEDKSVEDDARDNVGQTVKDAYSHFMKEWWPKEQARLAALNKDNPGIEMDI